MSLYNLRTDGDQWRITKFDNDLNVEASYLLSESECECPAGHRPSCRHRQMLPTMLAAGLADTGRFYDFDAKQVLVPITEEPDEPLPDGVERDNEEARFLEGMSQQAHTTFAYMEDGSVQITKHDIPHPIIGATKPAGQVDCIPNAIKPHPTIGPIKRRI